MGKSSKNTVAVKVTVETHRHADTDCKAGDVIRLRQEQADRLIKQGIAELTDEVPDEKPAE